MRRSVRQCLLAALAPLGLSACAGGGSSTSPPAPPAPIPPVVSAPDFSSVQAEVDRHPVADMALLVGDADGVLFSYSKSDFTAQTPVNIASATKLVTGLGVWSLVEGGALSEADAPQDWLDFWATEPTDPRSDITLSQLMSFTSGFNARPGAGCAGDGVSALSACVEDIFADGVDTAPGTAFSYGPEHMQVAALMARAASGQELRDIVRRDVLDASGAGANAGFRSIFGDNPRYSAGMIASVEDYGRVLQALLAGQLAGERDAFLADRTAGTQTAFQPAANSDGARDWHHGFGFWIECDAVPFQPSCNDGPTISSPGAFGFLPWVDFDAGYWAVIAMRQPNGSGTNPTAQSIDLEQILQPMIERALADAAP